MTRSKKPGRVPSIGVDLVELKKAKAFYESHKDNLKSFLTGEEIAYIRKNKDPHVHLAVLLAAKEAVFKSMGGAESGLASFSDICAIPETDPRLSFEVKKDYVVVQCAGT